MVDCYNEDEELAGIAVMIEDNLALPFETTVLRITVTVRKAVQTESGIVAICVRGKHRQAIPILDLPLPDRLPGAPNGSPCSASPHSASPHSAICSSSSAPTARVLPVDSVIRDAAALA